MRHNTTQRIRSKRDMESHYYKNKHKCSQINAYNTKTVRLPHNHQNLQFIIFNILDQIDLPKGTAAQQTYIFI